MGSIRSILFAAFFFILTGCATNEFAPSKTYAEGLSLKDSRLYIYSFLDIRDVEFGPTMLAEFDKQFTQELQTAGTSAKVLRFKSSGPGRYFSFTNSGVQIPVRDVITQNANDEKAMGAQYRLIIFPSKMTLSGAWKFYDVRWEIVDIRTDKVVWATTSRGKHLNAWRNDEDPGPRAKTIVNGIVEEMRKSKLL